MRRLIALFGVLAAIAVGVVAFLLLRQPKRPDLVLYCSTAACKPVTTAFTSETGIRVRTIAVSDAALDAQIVAEGRHPSWSVAWFDGATEAVALDRKGLLAHGLAAPQGLDAAGRALMPADGAYVPTDRTIAGVFVGAPSPVFTMPERWSDLVKPAYRGAVGMTDPALSNTAYDAVAGMLAAAGGWPAGKSFLNTLKANGLHLYASDKDVLSALRSGAIKLAIVPGATAFYYRAKVDRRLSVVVPKPAYQSTGAIVMAKNLRGTRAAEAKRFIDFVDSDAAETALRKQGGAGAYAWPVTAAAVSRSLPDYGTLDIAGLDPDIWGARKDVIVAWFSREISAGDGI